MRYLYSILFYLLLPFILVRLFWRSRHLPEYRKRIPERFGFCSLRLNRCVWIHAVSVGESIAAIPLIKMLKKQYPDIPILITNMTPTGAAHIKLALGDTVFQSYVTYDLPDAINRFLNRVNPLMAIVMETELWPNLFAGCKARNIPVVIANARLSEKSAQRYKRVEFFVRRLFTAVHAIASQGQADAERFIALGMPEEKVTITGNLKFDLELPSNLYEKSMELKQQLGKDRLIWIAASTHPTEEEIILSAHKEILKKFANALLILVPRHPDRFHAVAKLVAEQDLRLARRSMGEICKPDTHVYLGDTMGELLLMYAICDVAFVGGSLVMIGGHNMLEPAALSKPILTGKFLFNFSEISQMLLKKQGMLVIQTAQELVDCVSRFFSEGSYRQHIGKNALQVVQANRGALQKQLELIQSVMAEQTVLK